MAQKSFLQRTRPTIWADETTAMEKNAAVFFPGMQATFEPSESLKLKCDKKALDQLSLSPELKQKHYYLLVGIVLH